MQDEWMAPANEEPVPMGPLPDVSAALGIASVTAGALAFAGPLVGFLLLVLGEALSKSGAERAAALVATIGPPLVLLVVGAPPVGILTALVGGPLALYRGRSVLPSVAGLTLSVAAWTLLILAIVLFGHL